MDRDVLREDKDKEDKFHFITVKPQYLQKIQIKLRSLFMKCIG